MLILPERNVPRPQVLAALLRSEWMPPSQNEQVFTSEFHVTAFSCEQPIWNGVLQDRDEFDAFLHAIAHNTLEQQRPLWDYPKVPWHPDIDGIATGYHFATYTIVTSTATVTFQRPVDWNNQNNTIGAIGAGGGANGGGGGGNAGGAGAYAAGDNVTLTASSFTISIGTGGPGINGVTATAGLPTYFNGGSLAASSIGAEGGDRGNGIGSGSSGGKAANSIGGTKFDGGSGRIGTVPNGGGGAGGSFGAGAAGTSAAGGRGDNSLGGTGGTSAALNGNAGTEMGDLTFGAGGGGCGSSATTGGNGGLYGAGGGNGQNAAGGNGRNGILFFRYEPLWFGIPPVLPLINRKLSITGY